MNHTLDRRTRHGWKMVHLFPSFESAVEYAKAAQLPDGSWRIMYHGAEDEPPPAGRDAPRRPYESAVAQANLDRHGELVDKMFGPGLTDDEQAELDGIREWLDEVERPYYEPLIKHLEAAGALLDKLKEQNDRAALADALIAWAADHDNAYACEAYTVPFCLFCEALDEHHDPDCLHERAKALRDA